MGKEFEVVYLKPGEPVHASAEDMQVRPICLYVHPEGTLDNKPSFTFKCVDRENKVYYAQISDRMLAEAIMEAPNRVITRSLSEPQAEDITEGTKNMYRLNLKALRDLTHEKREEIFKGMLERICELAEQNETLRKKLAGGG